MDEIDDLLADRPALATILRSRRVVSTKEMSYGARILWGSYLFILEDTIKILDALIQFLKTRRVTEGSRKIEKHRAGLRWKG